MTTTDHPLDLNAISDKWLKQCGPHDFGVDSAGCACPDGDPRPVIASLVAEVEQVRRERDGIAGNEAEAIEWKQDFGVLSDAVNDLYEIHAPKPCSDCPMDRNHKICSHCGHWVNWPCPTVQRLEAACAELDGGGVSAR